MGRAVVRILMITDRIPFPVVAGASLRVYSLLRRIAREHEVWLTALNATPEDGLAVAHLRQFCSGVETADAGPAGALARPLDGLRYVLAGKPPDLRLHYSLRLADRIRQIVTRVRFNMVDIEFGHMGLYLELLPRELQQRSVWGLHDIDWSRYARISSLEPKVRRKLRLWLHARMMRSWKPRHAARFRRCVTVSELDRSLLLTANPRLHVDVVPNGVDTETHQPLEPAGASPALIFVGDMGYLPCADAVVSFCRDVLPRVRRAVASNVEIWIVGINPSSDVKALEGNGIHVTGRVDDVRPYYSRSTVCVVPLRAGGGTRLKILEAMALGRPVVSTSVGCEGLKVIDGEHLFIADHAEAFADRTARLLRDEALRRYIASRARELVVNHYDWDIIARQLMQIYTEVAR